MRSIFLILGFFSLATVAMATHNRAGEITYVHAGGNVYNFTITTYTKLSAPADRPWMPIDWGDNTPSDSLPRVEMIDDPFNDIRYNVYVGSHTYPGPGQYRVLSEDPNRNSDILNLGGAGSVNLIFTLETWLRINPLAGVNSSVQLLNPPLDEACIFQVYQHNPGAYDPDGDSLSYELVQCLGADGEPLFAYEDPDQIVPGPNNTISIDPVTGTVTWDSPQQVGIYNIAILITEYRRNSNGTISEVGSVLRDMQIFVLQCDNLPPVINPVPDVCVEAGENINFQVTASDPNDPFVQITGFGGPFEQASNPATISQINPSNSATFNWNTSCSHVRLAPYQVTFKVDDNNNSGALTAYTTSNITVVAPAPENPEANPQLGAILLNWDESPCSDATGYKIYRRNGLYGFEPGDCETGVPGYTGYTLLTELEGLSNTSFIDNNAIDFGVGYCYMVVACFPDGAQSYASEEFCAEIAAEIPLITHNSVGVTSTTLGIDTLRWQRPFDLDTVDVFTGPYQYRVYRGDGFDNTPELIYTSPENNELHALPGELFVENLNTETQANVYRVELLSDGIEVSFSSPASSIFLDIAPNDEQLNLSWNFNQPWVNYNYEIQRWDDEGEEWIFIGETGETSFIDSGLENGEEYCYRLIASGSYFNSVFSDTLINFSQELCETPFDNTPPCPPVLSDINCGDCDFDTEEILPNILTWTNSNDCEDTDDTQVYYIYFKPTEQEEFMLIDSVFGASNTTYEHKLENSFVGCYAITALDYDEVNDRRNESLISNPQCCDFENTYELPDVFTPNNDGSNDFFRAFPYCSIESVDLIVYNRWGQPVYTSTDPAFLWDGVHMDSGEGVPDGVYYYVCKVNYLRLEGLVSEELKGTVHLLGGSGNLNFR